MAIFPNLAGVEHADPKILAELNTAGIPAVPEDRYSQEVSAGIVGRLTVAGVTYTFSRAWYYYSVSGLVPLAVANQLYGDPLGMTDVRVAGHCGCPAPEDPWTVWFDASGRTIMFEDERQSLLELVERGLIDNLDGIHFVADKTERELVGRGFVATYHIDSPAGLKLFADTLHTTAGLA